MALLGVGNRIILCTALSTTAGWINRLAVPLVVYNISRSPIATSLAFAAAHLPPITVGLLSGAIVDRHSATRLIFAATSLSFLAIMAISWLVTQPHLYVLLFIFLFINSSLSSVQLPATHVVVVEKFAPEQRLRINSHLGMVDQLSSVMAPLATGAAVLLIPAQWLFYLSACAYLAASMAVLRIHSRERREFRRVAIHQDIARGFRTIKKDRQILACTVLFMFSNFASTLVQSTFVPLTHNRFGASATAVSVLFATAGLFGIAGHFLARKLVVRSKTAAVVLALTAISGALTTLMAANLGIVAFGFFWGVCSLLGCINVTLLSTYRQCVVPPHLVGRSVSAARFATYLPIPVAAILSGFAFDRLGGDLLLLASGTARLLGVVAILVGTFSFSRRTRGAVHPEKLEAA
ncbi:MFS transporter [Novosphingobium terrae]|uniref:MFS transporter n=1 Tax=Novosphingobium terrae TaxID=2726189 RepID=UPI001981B3DB|nr:MFS transporter [Novosphingobium terrae]